MVSRFCLVACGLASLLALSAAAQSSPTQSTPPSSQSATPQGGLEPGAPPLKLQNLPPDAHTPTPAELAEEHQRQLYAEVMRLASTQAHWGAPISTPGVSVTLIEAGRTKAPDGTTRISYHLTGAGFDPGEKLWLIRWPLDHPTETVMGGLLLNPKGTVVCGAPGTSAAPTPSTAPAAPAPPGSAAAPAPPAPAPPPPPSCTSTMKPSQPVTLEATAAPGEAIRVALVSENHKQGAATSAIPFPLASVDKSCKLQILLGMKNAAMVLVEGSGFPPNAILKLDTITGDSTKTLSAKTDPDGRLVAAMLPAEPGHPAGQSTVRYGGIIHPPTLQTSSTPLPPDPSCSPSVTIPWGPGSYKPQ